MPGRLWKLHVSQGLRVTLKRDLFFSLFSLLEGTRARFPCLKGLFIRVVTRYRLCWGAEQSKGLSQDDYQFRLKHARRYTRLPDYFDHMAALLPNRNKTKGRVETTSVFRSHSFWYRRLLGCLKEKRMWLTGCYPKISHQASEACTVCN